MKSVKVEVLQVLSRLFHPEMTRGQEVESADDINNPGFPTNFTGILRNIAYPCMRAACDDDKPLL